MMTGKTRKIGNDDEIGSIINEELVDDFCKSYILIGDEDTCMPEYYEHFSKSIASFEVRNSDIMVVSYPKTGTTWTQEMVWLIANDLDFKAAEVSLDKRFPHFELCTLYDFKRMEKALGTKRPEWVEDSVAFTSKQESPRLIKTHLPFSLLPQQIQNGSKTPKMIYVMRNPKDTCVSFYHHGKLLHGWRTTLDSFAKVFLADKALYGSFWKHVFGFWDRRNSPNILIITYEDMKKDLKTVINKVANFLNKTVSDKQIDLLLHHLSFESMKNNKAVNSQDTVDSRIKSNLAPQDGAFIRSGTVGKYKEEMSPETIRKLDAWVKENLADSSLKNRCDYLNV